MVCMCGAAFPPGAQLCHGLTYGLLTHGLADRFATLHGWSEPFLRCRKG